MHHVTLSGRVSEEMIGTTGIQALGRQVPCARRGGSRDAPGQSSRRICKGGAFVIPTLCRTEQMGGSASARPLGRRGQASVLGQTTQLAPL